MEPKFMRIALKMKDSVLDTLFCWVRSHAFRIAMSIQIDDFRRGHLVQSTDDVVDARSIRRPYIVHRM